MKWALSIDRNDISKAAISPQTDRPLADGEIRLSVSRFALTANNITYAAFGDAMRYWDFFPAAPGRGHLPVWGFADIAESTVEGLTEGERIYGYFPAASELIVSPGRIGEAGFTDMSGHRSDLPPAYNNYVRCAADATYSAGGENVQMVMLPLFITAFLLDVHLRDPETAQAETAIALTSASSKTAIALAWLLKQSGGARVDALTSPGNAEFVSGLGIYDSVTRYDDIPLLEPDTPRIIVDFAGASGLNRTLHSHLEGGLLANIRVGGAHWEQSAPARDLKGPKPQFFFAPDHARQRAREWGAEDFDRRYKTAWRAFAEAAADMFDYETLSGAEGALQAYNDIIAGEVGARRALCIAL
mgnify:CR=1 FL=1